MLKITAIDHIVLRTTKLQEMLVFYCDVLGCKVERQLPAETGLTQLRAGNALIDLVTVDSSLGKIGGGAPTDQDNNVDHFCLRLETVSESEIEQHLKANGIDAGEFKDRYGAEGMGRSVYISDPEGNTVELRSRIQR